MKLCWCELYFCLICVISECCFGASDYVNSKCRTSGQSGKCKLVTDCPIAIDSLERTQTHNLKRCGFDGLTEIVCCPVVSIKNPDDETTTTSNTDSFQRSKFTKRRCEKACEELSHDIKSKVNFHIIGGVDVDIEEFPHMAVLGYETDEGLEWDCGASLISNRYLLTAAHCIVNQKKIAPKIARMGITTLNETNPKDYNIINITVYTKYNPSTKHNDIALLKVKETITFSKKIYPACLYFENNDPLGLIVTGWGKTNNGNDRSNILQKAILEPMSLNQCNISYVARSSGSQFILGSQICAGSNESDACWGDSGGPLQIHNKAGSYSIVGIISYGAGCGGKIPGVYTRVSRYLEWIENIVWR